MSDAVRSTSPDKGRTQHADEDFLGRPGGHAVLRVLNRPLEHATASALEHSHGPLAQAARTQQSLSAALDRQRVAFELLARSVSPRAGRDRDRFAESPRARGRRPALARDPAAVDGVAERRRGGGRSLLAPSARLTDVHSHDSCWAKAAAAAVASSPCRTIDRAETANARAACADALYGQALGAAESSPVPFAAVPIPLSHCDDVGGTARRPYSGRAREC